MKGSGRIANWLLIQKLIIKARHLRIKDPTTAMARYPHMASMSRAVRPAVVVAVESLIVSSG